VIGVGPCPDDPRLTVITLGTDPPIRLVTARSRDEMLASVATPAERAELAAAWRRS
jgi:hypothetical protein